MPPSLSVDLRQRVVAAMAEGASFHRAAARFGVSVSSASRWSERFAQEGHVEPKPTHGDAKLPAIEAHADLILSLDVGPARTLSARVVRQAGRAWLADQYELAITLLRPPRLHPQKGALHAAEQERADVKAGREAWYAAQPDLDPDRLAFLDETAAATNMTRRYGRAPRGKRCRLLVPQEHYKTTIVTAALRPIGLYALDLADGDTNSQRFPDFVAHRLVPVLRAGNTVILDNLQAHNVAGVRAATEEVGARILYFPPYSPESNPIE